MDEFDPVVANLLKMCFFANTVTSVPSDASSVNNISKRLICLIFTAITVSHQLQKIFQYFLSITTIANIETFYGKFADRIEITNETHHMASSYAENHQEKKSVKDSLTKLFLVDNSFKICMGYYEPYNFSTLHWQSEIFCTNAKLVTGNPAHVSCTASEENNFAMHYH